MLMNNNEYLDLVQMVKQEIRQAQYKATLSVNKELIMLYHGIGRIINELNVSGKIFNEFIAPRLMLIDKATNAVIEHNQLFIDADFQRVLLLHETHA